MKATLLCMKCLCCTGILIFFFCNNSEVLPPLQITVSADSTVAVRDSLMIEFTAEGTDKELTWYIQQDNEWNIDSTTLDHYVIIRSFSEIGKHQLVVYAMDTDGRTSGKDTMTYTVISKIPEVTILFSDSADTMVYIHDTLVLTVTSSDEDGTVTDLVWGKGGEVPRIISVDSVLKVSWSTDDTGTLGVWCYAIDNDGQHSSIDTITTKVIAGVPELMSLSVEDSSVSVNDTVWFSVEASDDNGAIVSFKWIIDSDTLKQLSSPEESFQWVWHFPDTGIHTITVQSVDNDGLYSSKDSCTVMVTAIHPVIDSVSAPSAYAGTESTIKVTASDADGSVAAYQWIFETSDGILNRTTSDSTITHTWNNSDTGLRKIYLIAIDEDSLRSAMAVCSCMVYSDFPVLYHQSDTVLSGDDTLEISRTVIDSLQEIEMWLFDIDGNGWDDSSSTSSLYPVYYTGTSPVAVITGVRNSNDDLYQDTFYITFNLTPEVQFTMLTESDTLWVGEKIIPGTLAVPVQIIDDDSCTLQFIWGMGEALDTVFDTDTLQLPVSTTGLYNWEYTLADLLGNSIEGSGTTHVGREHLICFAGHSIPVGVGDETGGGGFRPIILSELRDSCEPYERMRVIGPFVTNYSQPPFIMDPKDDSCFAISGSFAREMQLLMDLAYPDLSADIWVLMLGVNGSFSAIETNATCAIMHTMANRNPDARIYVLTSQPYVDIPYYQRNYYNDNIRSCVDTLQQDSIAAFIVETGDSVLNDGGTFNDTLASDPVHPNNEGYRRMAAEILDVMWHNEPVVLPPWRPEE